MNDSNRTADQHPIGGNDDSIFERVVPDSMREKLKGFMGDLRFPRELVNYAMSQVDETKHAAVAIVAREVRSFLEKTNLSEEIVKVLTRVSFEVTTNIRFIDSENGKKKGLKFQILRTDPKSKETDSEPSDQSGTVPPTSADPATRSSSRKEKPAAKGK